MEAIKEMFERCDDEYLNFDRIENKLSTRPDMHAFILLDRLFPGTRDLVCHAEHDEIFLDVSDECLADANITEDQIRELVRCGVRLNDEGGLCMFA